MKTVLWLPPGGDGGVWYYRNSDRRSRMERSHRHAELELNLVTRGAAACLVDGQRLPLTRHSLLWLFPGQNHLLLDQSSDYEMWIVVWHPRLVRRVCMTAATRTLRRDKPPGEFCRLLAESPARRLGALLHELQTATSDALRFNAGLSYGLLTAWAVHQAAPVVTSGAEVHPAVDRAARFLRDDPTVSLTGLAGRAGLSPSRLSRLFKRQTGIALGEFRNRQRVERFLALIAHDRRRNLLDTALEAGFGSYPQFHRVFTRLMGCSPQRYQQNQPNG